MDLYWRNTLESDSWCYNLPFPSYVMSVKQKQNWLVSGVFFKKSPVTKLAEISLGVGNSSYSSTQLCVDCCLSK